MCINHSLQKILRASLALLAVIFLGCGRSQGPSRAPVAGLVTLNGVPLKSGVVRFIPAGKSKGPAAVAIVEDGEFELDAFEGPVIGHHRVEIEATEFTSFEIDDERAYARIADQGQPPIPDNPVPVQYNRMSTLVADISEEGDLDLEFLLKSQPQ
jgi:hypothetical protein